jgi:hypothetical protein
MVPAAFVPVCIWWWHDWDMAGGEWYDLALIPLGLAVILFIAAFVNLALYVYHYWADMYSEVRATQNMTSEVKMFEAARGMHPEAVKALLLHRRTIWRLKYVPAKDLVDWILDDAENVHAGFVDFVLDHSNLTSVMSKRLLSDGSKGFDPEDIVTDYEQYDSLILLMQQKLMITSAYGNQAPQWMPPWNPESARHRFGLDGAVNAEPESMSEAMMAVVRAQTPQRSSSASPQIGRASNLGGEPRDLIAEALDGLEQTQQMKAAAARTLKRS